MSYFERYKRRATKHGVTQNDLIIKHSRDSLRRNFSHIVGCTPVLVNGVRETQMVIESSSSDLEKKAITLPDEVVSVGDYLRFNKRLWLIKSINTDMLSPVCKLLTCNQSLNTQWFTKPIPCHANNTTYGSKGVIDNGSKFLELDAKTKLYIQKNEETDLLYLGFRFILNHRYVYRITEIENTIYGGIYVITCQMDESNDMDNFEENIAFNKKDATIESPSSAPDEEEEELLPLPEAELKGAETLRKGKSETYVLENGFGATWSIDDDTLASLDVLATNEACLTAKKKSGWVTLTCQYEPSLMPASSLTEDKPALIKQIMIY